MAALERVWGISLKKPTANRNKYSQIFKCRVESWQRTQINIISPSMLHLNRVESGKDDSSSEAHLQS
jgi:hypothetical protein